VLDSEEFAFQLTAYIGIFNLARRPQSPKGPLAADALRQRREGVKEGGKVKPYRSCAGQAQTECGEGENYYRSFFLRLFETGGKQELRRQKSDGRSQIICSLFSVFDAC